MRFELSLQIVKRMDSEIKKKATSFLKEYGLQNVTLENLRSVIQKQGYTIVEYNNIFNSENVATLINALELEDFCEHSKGFTYADTKRRLVFLHEDLSYEEKRMVLAHEEGHIYCNHLISTPILGRDVIEEHEANEFAHYLLNPSWFTKVNRILYRNQRIVLISMAGLALLAVVVAALCYTHKQQAYYGEYYITESGNKYHEKDCIFVKGKTNVHRMTEEEFESGEYEPCRICLP